MAFLLIIFSVVCLSKMACLALFDSILTTLESHLSQYCEGINSQDRVYLLYSVSGFNLPEESHHNHPSSVGFMVRLCHTTSTQRGSFILKRLIWYYILRKFLIFGVLKYEFFSMVLFASNKMVDCWFLLSESLDS